MKIHDEVYDGLEDLARWRLALAATACAADGRLLSGASRAWRYGLPIGAGFRVLSASGQWHAVSLPHGLVTAFKRPRAPGASIGSNPRFVWSVRRASCRVDAQRSASCLPKAGSKVAHHPARARGLRCWLGGRGGELVSGVANSHAQTRTETTRALNGSKTSKWLFFQLPITIFQFPIVNPPERTARPVHCSSGHLPPIRFAADESAVVR